VDAYPIITNDVFFIFCLTEKFRCLFVWTSCTHSYFCCCCCCHCHL